MICNPLSKTVMVSLVTGFLMISGCREHYPHSATWMVTGDTIPTHPEPPEGGYYTNWDPYAAEIQLEPSSDVNYVGTQHVFVATVLDDEGKPLPNRRVEWIVADGGVGDIVEVDESGWRASRGYKQDNHFAVSHTNNCEHVLDRGNDDPADDVELGVGQTWCVVTSPVEGTTNVIAYAPGIYDWRQHKVFAEKHWYDVAWEWPPAATNPTGTSHTLTTHVMKYSDGSPLEGYVVNYSILSGPAGTFDPGGTSNVSATTDAQGMATVTLNQDQPVPGTNEIGIDIIRPEDVQCCKPAVHIASGQTQKTWITPGIAIEKSAPARAIVNDEFTYTINVSSTAQVPANNVMVTDPLPDGIAYVSSQPEASVSGRTLNWSLGTMGPGTSKQLTVRVKGTRTGTFNNCAEVVADQGLSDRDCAETVITAPELLLEKMCPTEVLICKPITYTLRVSNRGDAPATNVRIVDTLPDGVRTTDGRASMTFNVGELGAGQSKEMQFNANADRAGQFTNTATASADRGLSSEANCTTTVREPILVVTKSGPDMRFIGRPATYEITVTNKGDANANNTVLVDTLPAGTTLIEVSDGGRSAEGKVTWDLGTLAPNASRTVSLTAKYAQRGSKRNTVRVTATCTEAEDEMTTEVRGIPAILLEVVDLKDPIEVGNNETYIITVTNQGSSDGTNIVIKCTLPPEMEFVSAEGLVDYEVDEKVVTFAALPSLDPKATATYRVITKGMAEGDLRFRVQLTSDQMSSPVDESESTHVYE